jgi:hypothetical protein
MECISITLCRKLILHKPEGIQWVCIPTIRWLDSVEESKH